MSDMSYHDVIVYVDEKPYRIADNYAHQLICTRAGGWALWFIWEGKEECLGSEFGDKPFRVEIGGNEICRSKPSNSDAS